MPLTAVCLLTAVPGWADETPATDGATWTLPEFLRSPTPGATVLGSPQAVDRAAGGGLRFNGTSDGLIVPVNVLEGLDRFTIELLLRPDADGPAEQRFFHAQDAEGHRALLELRLDPDGRWSLDTFLYSVKQRLALLDRTQTHPADRWSWVALVYDGATMSGYVDGVLQGSGGIVFPPMRAGQTSLGVRLNRVAWFKGAIREVRVHPRALKSNELSRATVPETAESAPR